MTRSRSRREVHRAVLANGLRVLLAPVRHVPRVAVSVHYGVGFRSESSQHPGLAHLFEHLMFRGSESLPEGRFYDHVAELGGLADGTTHGDYTDYFQVVPEAGLERALFSEADRMRAPRFTRESLAEQLAGVEEEIRQATETRPYGGFPWPLLPGVLYDTHANAHNGYGDPVALRNTTLATCEEFFDLHYVPENAVLTIVGGFQPERARELVEHHFAGIPGRPASPAPTLAEPPLTADRYFGCREPGIAATAVAVGFRLPDPSVDLPRYMTHLVLGHLFRGGPDARGGKGGAGQVGRARPPRFDATCGFFGPLDARDPDTFVVATLLPGPAAVDRALSALDASLRGWADGAAGAERLARAVRQLDTRHHRDHSQLLGLCRALGRLELLFGRDELLDELPGRLAAVSVADVAQAAAALQSQNRAVLAIEPGSRRHRPPTPGDRQTAAGTPRLDPRPATALTPESLRGRPRPIPPIGTTRSHRHAGFLDTVIAGGLRVVAVRDERAPVVEVRLRVPTGPGRQVAVGPPAPPQQLAHALVLAADAPARAGDLGGSMTAVTDGHCLDLTGHAPAAAHAPWLEILADLLTTRSFPEPVLAEAARRVASETALRTPEQLVEAAVRRQVHGHAFASARLVADPARLAGSPAETGPFGAVLVAVGDLDPQRWVTRVAESLSGWDAGGWGWHAAAASPQGDRVPAEPDDLLVLPGSGRPNAQLTCYATVPFIGDEPARYVATAILGGFHQSRLARRVNAGPGGYPAFAGRDALPGTAWAYVSASPPAARAAIAVAELRDELRRMGSAPPSPDEVAAATDYCAAELLSVFDSPTGLADYMRRTVSAGQDPAALVRLPETLRATGTDRVVAASRELFAEPVFGVVLLGEMAADHQRGGRDDDADRQHDAEHGRSRV